MAELLSAADVEREIAGLSGWERSGDSVTRTWERKGFNGAVQLANVVAFVANQLNHHPDISVHGYNKVTVTSTTHDAGGITANDVELARRINRAVGES
ncbi:4a-hydroxytetrahydrobiopterin dehydratase [Saccharopolyspora rosea]|uniref:Putative pterin-4-alpha-carbinolamine dehydratase n=1 Tax=Saccharopolyspora rosea TaxID=524884 RepID=A0ABW3FUJ5_9PSEU